MLVKDVASFRSAVDQRLIFSLLFLVPGIVWLISVGDITAYFTHHLPAGQLLYLFSKLFGLYAYFFMTVQIIIGVQGGKSPYFKFHPLIGASTTLAVLSHLILFITAASFRSGHLVLDNLVPEFNKGFYKGAVSLGVVSAYCLILVVGSAIFLRRFRTFFLMLHRLAFLVGALGFLHSFSIGTETRIPVVMAFYGCLLAWAIYHLLRRVIFCKAFS